LLKPVVDGRSQLAADEDFACAVREFVESCGFNLAFNTTIDTLTFKTFRVLRRRTLSFELWLVSLNRDSSLHSQYGGFGSQRAESSELTVID
jgi:hypothetical protein